MSAAEPAFLVTVFQDRAAKLKTEARLTLPELAAHIRGKRATVKEALPWLKFARFGSRRSQGGSLRWDGNVVSLSGVVVDYDGEVMSLEEAVERLDKAGIIALVYTSPSHQLNGHGPRWRVVCPFSEEQPPDCHYQMIARLNGLLGGVLASESFVLSQSFYFGSVNNNPAHQVVIVDGMMTLERCGELDQIAIGKPNGSGGPHPPGPPEAPIEDIRAALAVIINPPPSWPERSWNEWNNLGLALWRASGGSDEAFAEFDKWSSKSPKYDSDETEHRWRHYFESPPSRIGFGTLVYLARQVEPGWIPPSKRPKQPRKPIGPTGQIINPAAPLDTARLFRDSVFDADGHPSLFHHRGAFYRWDRAAWPELDETDLRALLYDFLDQCITVDKDGNQHRFKPNKPRVANILDALQAAANLPSTLAPPTWLDPGIRPDPDKIIACSNGLLNINQLELLPLNPQYFNHNALTFAYDRNAPTPTNWLRFLKQLWPDDPESIDTLQEIFGLCLTTDTRHQKAFLLIGPRRSGKGTIGRVLTALVGRHNAASPTLASLGTNFGLAPLIGKLLAVISDARLGARADQHAIAENILRITARTASPLIVNSAPLGPGKCRSAFSLSLTSCRASPMSVAHSPRASSFSS